MTLVVDASVVVAALLNAGSAGSRAEALLAKADLTAPHLLPAEVCHTLRRGEARGWFSHESAGIAHSNLGRLDIELFGYRPFAKRIWELRATVTPYDAWYIALAETMGARFATADARLSRAPGPRCEFLLLDPSPEA